MPLISNGGVANYNKDHKENENYMKALTFCTKDPKRKLKNTIGSISFSTLPKRHSIANYVDVRTKPLGSTQREPILEQ
jgi:hypothetical protein